MNTNQENEIGFEEFLAARLRDKGISLKKLAELTGIAPAHLENLFRGDFNHMPSTPYFHGYVVRIATVLDFDGEAWWTKLKKGDFIKNSGPLDALPKNRFVKKAMSKSWWLIGIAAVLLLIYGILTFPRITGRPALTVTAPATLPFVTTSTTFTISGIVANADALYLSNGDASSSEEITIAPDGSWQKSVLLQDGLNSFEITARKFLGGEANATEQIIYEAAASSSPASSTSTSGTSF